MCELKYRRLLKDGETFMGDIVCLEALRFFPATTRRFTKATV